MLTCLLNQVRYAGKVQALYVLSAMEAACSGRVLTVRSLGTAVAVATIVEFVPIRVSRPGIVTNGVIMVWLLWEPIELSPAA